MFHITYINEETEEQFDFQIETDTEIGRQLMARLNATITPDSDTYQPDPEANQ